MKNLFKQPVSLASYQALPLEKRWVLPVALATLLFYKGLLKVISFQRLMAATTAKAKVTRPLANTQVDTVVWAIKAISDHTPLNFTCLTQALAAKRLLKNHPDIILRIGVQKNPAHELSAHAWVVFQERVILGEQGYEAFESILKWA